MTRTVTHSVHKAGIVLTSHGIVKIYSLNKGAEGSRGEQRGASLGGFLTFPRRKKSYGVENRERTGPHQRSGFTSSNVL